MVLYVCEKCGKEFTHKNDWRRHQKIKSNCIEKSYYHKNGNNQNSDPPPQNMVRWGGPDPVDIRGIRGSNGNIGPFHYHQTLPKTQTTTLGTMVHYHDGNKSDKNRPNLRANQLLPLTINGSGVPENKNDSTIKCSYCGRQLKNRFSLKRHLRTCNQAPLTIEHLDEIKTTLRNELQKNKSNDPISITTNTINQNQTNIQNNIIVVNGSERHIRKFGNEDIHHITDEILSKAIECPQTGILKLIQQIHFNKNTPQNQNIAMTNKRDPYLEVFNGEQWEKQDKKIAIQNMITAKKDIMDDFIEERTEKNLLSGFIKDNYERFSEMLDTYVRESLTDYDDNMKYRIARNCQKLYRQLFKQAEIMLINNIKNKKDLENFEKDPIKFLENLD